MRRKPTFRASAATLPICLTAFLGERFSKKGRNPSDDYRYTRPCFGPDGVMGVQGRFIISPRRARARRRQLMQSEKPTKLVHWFTEECNNIIHRQMKLFPGKWIGVCALPQTAGDP